MRARHINKLIRFRYYINSHLTIQYTIQSPSAFHKKSSISGRRYLMRQSSKPRKKRMLSVVCFVFNLSECGITIFNHRLTVMGHEVQCFDEGIVVRCVYACVCVCLCLCVTPNNTSCVPSTIYAIYISETCEPNFFPIRCCVGG